MILFSILKLTLCITLFNLSINNTYSMEKRDEKNGIPEEWRDPICQRAINSFQNSNVYLVKTLFELPEDGILRPGNEIVHRFSINSPFPLSKRRQQEDSPLFVLMVNLSDFLTRVISLHTAQTLVIGDILLDETCTIVVPSSVEVPELLMRNKVLLIKYNRDDPKKNSDRDASVRRYIEAQRGYPITFNLSFTDYEEVDQPPISTTSMAKINEETVNVNLLNMKCNPVFFSDILCSEKYRSLPYTISYHTYKGGYIDGQIIPIYKEVGHLFAFEEAYKKRSKKEAKFHGEELLKWIKILKYLDKKSKEEFKNNISSLLKTIPKEKKQKYIFNFRGPEEGYHPI